ncbi:MAG TPA: 3-phosphoshikimate 1-carboxyvinyltransferase [Cytophagales bacterium]|nr:3-phosphoshikimate 1-carboxyvinyltransferase [Cytophagales bacterium]HAA20755.1 3-phosphoshikimate 1-carboxyvinyltransferase [Cytophagales bacterium]HAP63395.1 3-phosphoshikimate 1-carboxyvinyltransferase [Cytophagales bacterium]
MTPLEVLTLQKQNKLQSTSIFLASSKSESNRALIIHALAGGADDLLNNLSSARDTRTMLRLLSTEESTWDVLDAGTTMRFLTSYAAVKKLNRTLTGTARMQQRPIGILVDALRTLGAEIDYQKEDGYPPLHVKGWPAQTSPEVSVRGDVSSQYISSLLMIGPILPKGLRLGLTGPIGSRPYIEMTVTLMRKFGAEVTWEDERTLIVAPQPYQPTTYTIESDWSGASYWFSMVALAEEAQVTLLGLREDSLQGDQAIVDIMSSLGVRSQYTSEGVELKKGPTAKHIEVDFTHCPDLGQTVAVTCAAKGVSGTFTGLESLRIKETDRIAALQAELAKFGASLTEPSTGTWELIPSSSLPDEVTIHTYEDHRMAMAFAPLATRMTVHIEEPDVVQKSYPEFWEHVRQVGIETKG